MISPPTRMHLGVARGQGKLPQQMIGKMGRLDLGIEKELAPFGRLGIVGAAGRVALGKIFAPFLVLLAQLLELLVPLLGLAESLSASGFGSSAASSSTGLISISC